MAKTYRLKRRRPRAPWRAAAAVSGLALAGLVMYGAATVHMPAQQAPAVAVTQDAPQLHPAAGHPAAAKAAKSHHLLAGALAAHRLVHAGGYHRPFWRVRRVRRWFR